MYDTTFFVSRGYTHTNRNNRVVCIIHAILWCCCTAKRQYSQCRYNMREYNQIYRVSQNMHHKTIVWYQQTANTTPGKKNNNNLSVKRTQQPGKNNEWELLLFFPAPPHTALRRITNAAHQRDQATRKQRTYVRTAGSSAFNQFFRFFFSKSE